MNVKIFIFSLIWASVIPLQAEDTVSSAQELAMVRYQPIIERNPFGSPPPPPPVEAVEQPEAPLPKDSQLRFLEVCAFTLSDDGSLTVGLLNPKEQLVYYLGIGETSDDGEFTVIGANYEKEGVEVRQGGHERWIYNASAPSTASASADNGGDSMSRGSPSSTREAIMERFRRRRSSSVTKATTVQYSEEELKNQLSPEEMQKHLQKVQMDIIRSGGEAGPVLPVPLTVESDNQLVEEGVLPPR
jgi:hypothetical protein